MSIRLDIKKKFKNFTLSSAFETQSRRFALLGSSGSGKSTTLKCLAGLIKPDEGVIVCDGKVLYSSSDKINVQPQKRRIAYLFQHFALFDNMNAEDNIRTAFIPRIKKKEIGKNEAETTLKKILFAFHLENVRSLYPRYLSFGQQQRVALARLVANKPDVIIFDEPFSALDYRLKIELEVELLEFLEQFDGTAIFVSHNKSEVLSLCDEVCVMKNGIIGINQPIEKFRMFPSDIESAKILEIENITSVEKIADDLLYLSDWDLQLRASGGADIRYAAISSYKFDIRENMSENTLKATVMNVYEDGEYFVYFCRNSASVVLVARQNKNAKKKFQKKDTVYLSFDRDDLIFFQDELKTL